MLRPPPISTLFPYTTLFRSLRQIALGDRRGHLRDVAHLPREVRRHRVHVVGEVLPGAGHSGHLRLAPELAVGAHLARHPRHFRSKPAELIDHRVDDLPYPQEFTP